MCCLSYLCLPCLGATGSPLYFGTYKGGGGHEKSKWGGGARIIQIVFVSLLPINLCEVPAERVTERFPRSQFDMKINLNMKGCQGFLF